MRVRPRRIEIHVNGKRAGPPDGKGCKERPAVFYVLASQAKSQQQPEKTVEPGGEGHGDAVGSGKAVGGNGRTEGAGEKDAGVSQEQKRSPKDGGTDTEVILKMAGGRAEDGLGPSMLVDSGVAKTGIRVLIVAREVEAMLDERRADQSVVANTVAAHPGIQKGRSEEHTSELQSRFDLVCRLLLEKKKYTRFLIRKR